MNRHASVPPIGLLLSTTAREVSRAFDAALAEANGSSHVWLILMSLKRNPGVNQRMLAELVGIQGATLTHHLNAMEAQGLVTRRRDPANRRMHIVELTDSGEAAFQRMLQKVIAFDKRLRAGFDERELDAVRRSLAKLRQNVTFANDLDSTIVIAEPNVTRKGA
jgi:MarR family transcriptional regulator for hemolysin